MAYRIYTRPKSRINRSFLIEAFNIVNKHYNVNTNLFYVQ